MHEPLIRKREISAEEIELAPRGELAGGALGALQRAFEEALRGTRGKISLNLEDVERMGSAAVGKILQLKKRCDQEGRQLIIRRCRPETLALLRMVKIDTMIEFEA
jgi:anti-anti-sigma factor